MNRCAVLLGIVTMTMAAGVLAAPLITEAEAKLPAAEKTIVTRAITRGPGIKVVSPDLSAEKIASPFQLKIAFEPRGGAKIDTSAVKLTYLKTPNIELLDRVKGSLTENGIDVSSAEVPQGQHEIRVSIQDSEGRQSSAILKLNVVR